MRSNESLLDIHAAESVLQAVRHHYEPYSGKRITDHIGKRALGRSALMAVRFSNLLLQALNLDGFLKSNNSANTFCINNDWHANDRKEVSGNADRIANRFTGIIQRLFNNIKLGKKFGIMMRFEHCCWNADYSVLRNIMKLMELCV